MIVEEVRHFIVPLFPSIFLVPNLSLLPSIAFFFTIFLSIFSFLGNESIKANGKPLGSVVNEIGVGLGWAGPGTLLSVIVQSIILKTVGRAELDFL